MYPLLNPLHNQSSSFIEDDYVWIEKISHSKNLKSLKDKLVYLKNPSNPKEKLIRRIQCIEGEWCPAGHGFVFVQSGHVWVTADNRTDYENCSNASV